jgi:hypothetical protein
MLAQDELRSARFAEFETDAPDNIWHPEFKQEQLDLQKKQLQAMISASAPPVSEQLQVPVGYENPVTMPLLPSIPEYQMPLPIYDYAQHPQQNFAFASQLQQPSGMLASQDNVFARQEFQSFEQAQPQDSFVNLQPVADPRAGLNGPEIMVPIAGQMSASQQLQQLLDMPAAGTKTVPVAQVNQSSHSRVLGPLQSA